MSINQKVYFRRAHRNNEKENGMLVLIVVTLGLLYSVPPLVRYFWSISYISLLLAMRCAIKSLIYAKSKKKLNFIADSFQWQISLFSAISCSFFAQQQYWKLPERLFSFKNTLMLKKLPLDHKLFAFVLWFCVSSKCMALFNGFHGKCTYCLNSSQNFKTITTQKQSSGK